MSPLAAKGLRILLRGAYTALLMVCFAGCAYISFKIFVLSGATAVPSLVGLSEAEAAAVLSDHGLEVRRFSEGDRFDPEVPTGSVVDQTPPPRTLVKRGSEIELILSLGPERLRVPDLSGMALPAAQVTLAAAGLALGRSLRVYSPLEGGTVVHQHPSAGTQVAPSTPVDLLLSQGSDEHSYLMPDLVYRNYEDVRSYFIRHGFRFGSVKFELYEGARAGVILRQFPLAGHHLTQRDAISLVVAAPGESRFQGIG